MTRTPHESPLTMLAMRYIIPMTNTPLETRRRRVVTQEPQAEPEFLTARQVSKLTGLGLQTVYDYVRAGILPGRQVSGKKKGRYVIPKASLLRYLEGDWSKTEGGAGR